MPAANVAAAAASKNFLAVLFMLQTPVVRVFGCLSDRRPPTRIVLNKDPRSLPVSRTWASLTQSEAAYRDPVCPREMLTWMTSPRQPRRSRRPASGACRFLLQRSLNPGGMWGRFSMRRAGTETRDRCLANELATVPRL